MSIPAISVGEVQKQKEHLKFFHGIRESVTIVLDWKKNLINEWIIWSHPQDHINDSDLYQVLKRKTPQLKSRKLKAASSILTDFYIMLKANIYKTIQTSNQMKVIFMRTSK